jgi:hypothetical protein
VSISGRRATDKEPSIDRMCDYVAIVVLSASEKLFGNESPAEIDIAWNVTFLRKTGAGAGRSVSRDCGVMSAARSCCLRSIGNWREPLNVEPFQMQIQLTLVDIEGL